MSVHRRLLRRLAVLGLAVPVIVFVYLATLLRRAIDAPRLLLASLLGAFVIGSVYADEAYRRAPDGLRHGLDSLSNQRVSPIRAAMVLALAVSLLGVSAPASPATAADPAEAVIKVAREYLGTPYRLGGTGPRRIDCSGLIFRIFADAGELPRVGGKRLRAVGYLRWFQSRGLTSKRNGERGDLVVWGDGAHIGIYLGKDRVISALTHTGVTVHGLHAINLKFTTFLKVQWKVGDGTGGEDGRGRKDRDKDKKNQPGSGDDAGEVALADDNDNRGRGRNQELSGLATGTMNLRRDADPEARIVGWVSRGSRFTITGQGESPSGALWYSIEMRNGKSGWVWSRWVQLNEN